MGDAAPEVARDEAGESTATEESSLIDSIAPLGLMDVLVNRIPTPQGSNSRSASDDQRVTNAYLVGDVEIYIHAHDRDGSSNVSGHATGHALAVMAGTCQVSRVPSSCPPTESSSPNQPFKRSRNWVIPWLLRTCSAKCFACSHSRGVLRAKRWPMIEILTRIDILTAEACLPFGHHQDLSTSPLSFPLVVHLSRILSASKNQEQGSFRFPSLHTA